MPACIRSGVTNKLSVLGVVVVLGLAGCTGTTPEPSPSGSPTSAPSASETLGVAPPPPASEPADDGIEYRVTYPFQVPASPVTVTNPVSPPVGPYGLPYLVGVYTGDHPEGDPAYQRISFYFREAFPSYRFGYVPAVVQDGSGNPVAIDGVLFLTVTFMDAQAHNDGGASTVVESAPTAIGFTNLVAYAPAGDFEGQVTYGLGLRGPGGSGQQVPIRAGELKRPDGAGGFFYVVHFDVRTS